MGLEAGSARLSLDLTSAEGQVLANLRGETLPGEGQDGWVLVTVDGFPLGWGRRVKVVLKNYYPKGLRSRT